MPYHLRNVSTGKQKVCQTLEEAHDKVNDIVGAGEEWVVHEIFRDGNAVGSPGVVSSGRGPIPRRS